MERQDIESLVSEVCNKEKRSLFTLESETLVRRRKNQFMLKTKKLQGADLKGLFLADGITYVALLVIPAQFALVVVVLVVEDV